MSSTAKIWVIAGAYWTFCVSVGIYVLVQAL